MADNDERYGKKASKVDARLVIGVLVLILIGIFVAQNRDDVQLSILMVDITMPLWIGLLITVVLSLGVGFMLGRGRYKA